LALRSTLGGNPDDEEAILPHHLRGGALPFTRNPLYKG
jgi:hypothetical protein